MQQTFGGLVELVATLSAEHSHVPRDCVERLEAVGQVLAVTIAQPELAFNQSIVNVGGALSGKKQADAKRQFIPLIKAAAMDAKLKFDKHVPKMLVYLRRRMQWDPRNRPSTQPGGKYTKVFLGCLDSVYGPKIVAQYLAYIEWWPTSVWGLHTDEEQKVSVVVFLKYCVAYSE